MKPNGNFAVEVDTRVFELVEERDNANWVGNRRVLADLVGDPFYMCLNMKPTGIDDERDNVLLLAEIGEGSFSRSYTPLELVRAGVIIGYKNEDRKDIVRRANGYRIIDISRTEDSEGSLRNNDFVKGNTRYSITLQFCRYTYKRKRNRRRK